MQTRGSMDLFFEPTRGKAFSIEVGYFDTVLEIKESIEKHQGIPVSKQTLIFNGQVLPDELNVHFSEILDRSHIQLVVAPDPEKLSTKDEDQSPVQPPLRKVQLLLKKSPASKVGVVLEIDANETVRRLKERIHEMEGVPVNRLVLRFNGGELNDQRVLQDYELSDRSEIEISVRPSPTTSSSTGSGNANSAKKLRVTVLTKCGTRKIPVEVSASENVGELRKELQKLQNRHQFQLPPEGYFFIYKQNVMEEDQSFRWHQVSQGDTIEIFNGSVTGGS
ncbi:hypothetical protein U1Q18_039812 [Sarracenia purpurea var. burkii]